MELNSVQKFYLGKTLLITGATGFMGKVLLEKLLYSCSDVKEIMILCREKRGQSAQERVEKMKKLELFKRLVAEKPEMFSKIRVVSGDISQADCGLNSEDFKRVVTTSEIVFHLAASLKNEASLSYNVVHNLVSTKNVLEMAKKMQNLIHIQHLSTAFCNIEPEYVYEKVYPLHHDPDTLIRMSQEMTDQEINSKQVEILGLYPNTYVFTKRLAEILVEREFQNLPICITRPTVVLPTYAEPFPGWVDSLNGIVGLMYAAGAGVLRSVLCCADANSEYIPVDMSISAMILFARRLSTSPKWKEIPIITTTCNDDQKLEIGRLFRMIRSVGRQFPLTWAVWYPDGNITDNKYLHNFNVFLFQVVPAHVLDLMLKLFNQKPFLVRVQEKLKVGIEVLGFYMMRHWNFNQKNFQDLFKDLSQEEYDMFFIDCASCKNEYKYIENCIVGGRLYCANDPPSTLPRARVINKIQFVIHYFCKFFFYWFVIKLLLKALGLYQPLYDFLWSGN